MLERKKAKIVEERSSRSAPMTDADVKALLDSVNEVVIARGKASRTAASRDVALDDLKGPTGSYRAPMLRVGRKLLVGFHPDTLERLLGG